jgi:hypothetical protein
MHVGAYFIGSLGCGQVSANLDYTAVAPSTALHWKVRTLGFCASTFTLGQMPEPLAGTEAELKLLRRDELLELEELAEDLLSLLPPQAVNKNIPPMSERSRVVRFNSGDKRSIFIQQVPEV